MVRPRFSTVLALLLFGGIGLAIVLEWARPRPAPAPAVVSRPPLRPDETDRLDGGFTWSGTSGGKVMFQLLAATLLGTEGGVHLLRDVKDLKVFLPDGRPVLVSARGGKLQQNDDAGRDVEISLDGNVRVQDPDGIVFETQRVLYETTSRRVRAPSPSQMTGPDFQARAETMMYQPDLREIRGGGGVMVRFLGKMPWQVNAQQALFLMRQNEIHFEQPFVVRFPGQVALSGPGTVWLSQSGRPPRFEGNGPVLLAGENQGVRWQLAATALRTTSLEVPTPPGIGFVAEGPASLVARRQDPAGEERWVIHTRRWTVEPAPPKKTRAVASPGFSGSWFSPGANEGWEFEGGRLELLQDSRQGLERIQGQGQVILRGPDQVKGSAETVAWEKRDPDVFVLTGNPAMAEQKGDSVEAPRLRVFRIAGQVIGEGGTVTQLGSLGSSSADTLFGRDEPVRVRSQDVTLDRNSGKAEFRGPVQAWQGPSYLKAGQLTYDKERKVLVAQGEVRVRREQKGKSGTTKTVRLACGRLEHRDTEKKILLTGRSTYTTIDGLIEADRMTILLGMDGDVRYLEAEGEVKLDAALGEGRGDRLVWEGGEEGSALLTGDKRMVELRKRPGGDITRAKSLRYYPADGRIVGDGGSGRTTIEGTPPAEKPQEKDPS